MADFAKIINASDGAQVLFFKATDDEDGRPQLRQITEFEGVFAAFNMTFSDDDAGWDKLDAAFDTRTQEDADAVRKAVTSMLGADHA